MLVLVLWRELASAAHEYYPPAVGETLFQSRFVCPICKFSLEVASFEPRLWRASEREARSNYCSS